MFANGWILLAMLSVLSVLLLWRRIRDRLRRNKWLALIPGPSALPILGNTLEINVAHDEIFTRMSTNMQIWGGMETGINRFWLGSQPYVFLYRCDTVEPILTSSKHIEKSYDYNYLHPWLGTGLLTSKGQKWHSRRKILTPTFHFRILEDFMEVFTEQSDILVQKLEKEVNNSGFNIFPYATLFALDVICETAMGIRLNAQDNQNSEYVKAIYDLGDIILTRQARIWLQNEKIFRFSKYFKKHSECIKVLHGFSNKVIQERKEEVRQKKLNDANKIDDVDVIGIKKRLAFLDLLIEASKDGAYLSNEDIREEVDTFMFEGHDTTSAAISWCLFLIGSDMKIQEKVYEEIERVLGDDPITSKALAELKYLECCIKEALRLFPSVPMLGRILREDTNIAGYLVPAGTTTAIMVYVMHRDPKTFPHPEVYDPDRFLPENCLGRHPYAYVPFSAGPRNCIGQKFAMLEEKCAIATVLRNYRIEAVDRRENLVLLGELILRPKDGLTIKITPRKSN
ncbi:cytochrome P450 4c3 [Neocloeon triangulifer]|uniref:cytochrome P450 4c3 n=1 Tax=Neocloeon triangulifer TaxID=2078957 RepID=UPI00286F41C0|nr:cytochrome P450 4c3 [Neocloeon triangulifer]